MGGGARRPQMTQVSWDAQRESYASQPTTEGRSRYSKSGGRTRERRRTKWPPERARRIAPPPPGEQRMLGGAPPPTPSHGPWEGVGGGAPGGCYFQRNDDFAV